MEAGALTPRQLAEASEAEKVVLAHVARNLYEAVPEDLDRDAFLAPEFVTRMVGAIEIAAARSESLMRCTPSSRLLAARKGA